MFRFKIASDCIRQSVKHYISRVLLEPLQAAYVRPVHVCRVVKQLGTEKVTLAKVSKPSRPEVYQYQYNVYTVAVYHILVQYPHGSVPTLM
jgi:hypothetical protein